MATQQRARIAIELRRIAGCLGDGLGGCSLQMDIVCVSRKFDFVTLGLFWQCT
jgi:hypothetical protein